jgi:predicted RNA-binding Zn ribbon-like protein
MAGESEAPVQPGGRAPAPGDLALVQSFINSHFDLEFEHGADLLGTPQGAAGWLATHELLDPRHRLRAAEHAELIAAREALRSLAGGGHQPGNQVALERGAPVRVALAENGPRWERMTAAGIDGALGLLLAIAGQSMLDGSWGRLKICPGDHCGWAFFDTSRNLSGRWCSMAVCGSRAKARAHYRRHRG